LISFRIGGGGGGTAKLNVFRMRGETVLPALLVVELVDERDGAFMLRSSKKEMTV
jgi:hypothetical protein